MSIALGTILSSIDSTTKIAEYLKLVESTNKKVDKLISMHLGAAKESLENALRTNNVEEYKTYINRAKFKYIDAISAEKFEGQFEAYLGFAFCNHLSDDKVNMLINIKKAYVAYVNIWNEAPDKEESFLEEISDAACNGGSEGIWTKIFTSVVTWGTIPLISFSIEGYREYRKYKIKKILDGIEPIAEQLMLLYPELLKEYQSGYFKQNKR